jgi:hypothetical protein
MKDSTIERCMLKHTGVTKMTAIYARDLRPELLKDSFMGKGFEKLLQKYADADDDLVVGEFDDSWKSEVAK